MEGSKYAVCPGCEALLAGSETECPNCGTPTWPSGPEDAEPKAPAWEIDVAVIATTAGYEYAVHLAAAANELAKLLNDLAAEGWEPFSVYGGTTPERPGQTTHFAVMRRRIGA